MPAANAVKNQIDGVVRYLVEMGLASDQNFAIQRAVPVEKWSRNLGLVSNLL